VDSKYADIHRVPKSTTLLASNTLIQFEVQYFNVCAQCKVIYHVKSMLEYLSGPSLPPRRLLRTRSHLSRSVMVSVGVSVLGVTGAGMHFVNPGVKIASRHGRHFRIGYFIFQQDIAPVKETVDLSTEAPAQLSLRLKPVAHGEIKLK